MRRREHCAIEVKACRTEIACSGFYSNSSGECYGERLGTVAVCVALFTLCVTCSKVHACITSLWSPL